MCLLGLVFQLNKRESREIDTFFRKDFEILWNLSFKALLYYCFFELHKKMIKSFLYKCFIWLNCIIYSTICNYLHADFTNKYIIATFLKKSKEQLFIMYTLYKVWFISKSWQGDQHSLKLLETDFTPGKFNKIEKFLELFQSYIISAFSQILLNRYLKKVDGVKESFLVFLQS